MFWRFTDADVAVVGVTPSKTVVTRGEIVYIYVDVENQGSYTETFQVTVFYDGISIGTQTVANLAAEASTTLTFTWDTIGVAPGTYTIKAEASTVPDETDTTDNTKIDGLVLVTIAGDVNGDRTCDMADISMIIDAFMTEPGYAKWNSNCDINNDNSVDMADISIAIDHFMEAW